ncbi:MAG: tryptophan synthase subunit alpha, partial [bacterium]
MELEQYIRSQLKKKSICIMTHVIAGYPSFDDNFRELDIMAENNVDIVEIQMPFSEPTADGAVFVRANQESLKRGTTVNKYFEFMQKVAFHFDFPFLMMGYYNTVFKMGENAFIDRLKSSGGKGFIIPDLPIEEGVDFYKYAKQNRLAPIAMMAPTTPNERLKIIGEAGSGFIYVVARKGVTGKQTKFDQIFKDYIKRCHEATNLPLAVGF